MLCLNLSCLAIKYEFYFTAAILALTPIFYQGNGGDLLGRSSRQRLTHNMNLGQPASRSACCPLPGHRSQEVISGHQLGKAGVRPSEGASLPPNTAFSFPNALIRLLPRALRSVRPGQGQSGECSGALLRP